MKAPFLAPGARKGAFMYFAEESAAAGRGRPPVRRGAAHDLSGAGVAKATFATINVVKVAFTTGLDLGCRHRTSSDVAKASFPTLKVGKEAFTDITPD
ncbi:hypothetical protein ACFWMR_12975, partial [Amycolatopsis thailandensis]|uniref:hypothetical protein n=1 Tax=Amycolatopsis thailandensis TaxID=589330 RepID=UPI0036586749